MRSQPNRAKERLPFRGELKWNSRSWWKFSGKKKYLSRYCLFRPKFSVPFVRITSAKLHVERKWKIYRYFVNGTTQYPFCFRCQKKYQYHLTEIFHQNFRINGKRSREIIARIQRKTSQVFTQKI